LSEREGEQNDKQTANHDHDHCCRMKVLVEVVYTFPKLVLANNSLASEPLKPAAAAEAKPEFVEKGSKLNAVVAVGDCDASARSRPPVVNIVAL